MVTNSATLGATEPCLIGQDWPAYTPQQHLILDLADLNQ